VGRQDVFFVAPKQTNADAENKLETSLTEHDEVSGDYELQQKIMDSEYYRDGDTEVSMEGE
jgi:hypothetical protein